jgi:hypothetical protein
VNVSTFYALFSTTCFTLAGLWWGVVQRDTRWARDPVQRRAVGGVYLAFLLPALMGLFAQVGGTQDPLVWRLSFIVIAVIGVLATLRLLAVDGAPGVASMRAGAAGIYALVAVIGVFPGIAEVLGLRAIQVEALLLVLLVALGHALVWRFLVHDAVEAKG